MSRKMSTKHICEKCSSPFDTKFNLERHIDNSNCRKLAQMLKATVCTDSEKATKAEAPYNVVDDLMRKHRSDPNKTFFKQNLLSQDRMTTYKKSPVLFTSDDPDWIIDETMGHVVNDVTMYIDIQMLTTYIETRVGLGKPSHAYAEGVTPNIRVRYGNQVIMDTNLIKLMRIARGVSVIKGNILSIPIHRLIFGQSCFLPICKLNYIVELYGGVDSSSITGLRADCYKLTEDEARRYSYCANEYVISMYEEIDPSNENPKTRFAITNAFYHQSYCKYKYVTFNDINLLPVIADTVDPLINREYQWDCGFPDSDPFSVSNWYGVVPKGTKIVTNRPITFRYLTVLLTGYTACYVVKGLFGPEKESKEYYSKKISKTEICEIPAEFTVNKTSDPYYEGAWFSPTPSGCDLPLPQTTLIPVCESFIKMVNAVAKKSKFEIFMGCKRTCPFTQEQYGIPVSGHYSFYGREDKLVRFDSSLFYYYEHLNVQPSEYFRQEIEYQIATDFLGAIKCRSQGVSGETF